MLILDFTPYSVYYCSFSSGIYFNHFHKGYFVTGLYLYLVGSGILEQIVAL